MNQFFIFLFSFAVFAMGVVSCNNDKTVDTSDLHPVTLSYPKYVPAPRLSPDNPLTQEGIALGKKLYYDPILSNNGRSCSSCHLQEHGFSDPISNALPHVNLVWNRYFLWNGKIEGTLENAMNFEVREFFNTDVAKINAHPVYPALFKKVFKVNTVEATQVAMALSQFMATQISMGSRVDRYLQQRLMLNDDELRGFYIFNTEKGDCFHCHSVGLFTDGTFHNIGLDSVFSGVHRGRFSFTGDDNDMGKFKTPSLKNVALTAPYMHDGRFQTLQEVIEFYNAQVKHSATLDPIMTKQSFENGLQLTPQDKIDLLAFLRALTDSAFINNPDLAAP